MAVLSITTPCGHTLLPATATEPERVIVALTAEDLEDILDNENLGASLWSRFLVAHRALTGFPNT